MQLHKSGSILSFSFLLMLSLSACTFKSGTGSSNTATATSSAASPIPGVAIKAETSASNTAAATVIPTGLTGTYIYKTARYHNEFKVQQISDNQIRVQFSGTTEYKLADGEPMADSGSTAPQIVALDVATKSTGVLIPEDGDKDCRITLRFSGNKLNVEQRGFCGFGAKVSVAGSYTRTSSLLPALVKIGEMAAGAEPDKTGSPPQIRFARGKSSATVAGRIQKGKEAIYTFDAGAGQTVEVKVTTDSSNNDVVFSVTGPGGAKLMDDVETEWKGSLPKTGTYRINVGAIESGKANFKLTLAIR